MCSKGAWIVVALSSFLIAAEPVHADARAKTGDVAHAPRRASAGDAASRQPRLPKAPVEPSNGETSEDPETTARYARVAKVIKPLVTEMSRIAEGDLRGVLLVATAVDGWVEVDLFVSRDRYVRRLRPTPRLQDLTERLHRAMAAIGLEWQGLDWSAPRSGRSRRPSLRIVTPKDFPKDVMPGEWREQVLAKRFRGKRVIDPDADDDPIEPVPES